MKFELLEILEDFEFHAPPGPGKSNAMISDPFFLSSRLNVLRNVYIFRNIMQIGKYRVAIFLFDVWSVIINKKPPEDQFASNFDWGTCWKHMNIISLFGLKVLSWIPKLIKM